MAGRNYWFWVAKRDATILQNGEWGDCGPEVQPGDLSLIYHISPKSWIQELAEIKSSAEPDCPIKKEKGYTVMGHCCEYKILHEFRYPLTFQEMNVNQVLSEWEGMKNNLQRMYFPVDEISWNTLDMLLQEINEDNYKGYKNLI